jgi:hypothetical protein
MESAWSTARNGRAPRTGKVFSALVASPGSAKWEPDDHLYEVCYLLDKSNQRAR